MRNWLTLLIITGSLYASAQIGWMSTFESLNLSKNDTFWNGADLSGGFANGNAYFKNNFDTTYKAWKGVSVSNMMDSVSTGYTNQYSVRSAKGVNFTNQYAVVSQQATVVLNKQQVVNGCYINNATYPALSMLNGDGFAKKFGGTDGNDADYFRVIAKGYIGSDSSESSFYLADYRFTDNSKDYVVTNWTHWNLQHLGDVDSIVFRMESSDTGQYGMNTPAFFCLDNFNADSLESTYDISDIFFNNEIDPDTFLDGAENDGGFVVGKSLFVNEYNPKWKSWQGWSMSSMTDTVDGTFNNQYSCISGAGFHGAGAYLTGYKQSTILFPFLPTAHFNTAFRAFQFGVNNTTYAYKTMQEGNQFAKKFGGVTGNDKDFLVLKVVGMNYDGSKTDTIAHYLADYRFEDNALDYIQKDWDYVDISNILSGNPVVRLDFWVEGSDTGQFGLNTPGYFCFDNFLPLIGSVSDKIPVDLTLYPNPTKDFINVATTGNIKAVQVYDLLGNLQSFTRVNETQIDVSSLAKGLYIIRLETNQGIISKQFIKS
ncbi:MAG: hypothetical protein ACI9JN_000704 [Bacteroidia bacterium]|jgi:hypothetical protein